jgi:hypothetical protein
MLVGATLARRRGQAGRDFLRVLDGQYDCVVLAVGQVDDDPGLWPWQTAKVTRWVSWKLPTRMPGSSVPAHFRPWTSAMQSGTARTPVIALRGNA